MAKHGRYKIVRKIADGGMAEIFLATQLGREGFQKPVILKRIHSTIYADPQFRNMFIDEAHISMGLSHSNIVQILDLGVSAGRYFLVMEVVDGWDLGRVIFRAAQAGTALPRDLGLHITGETCRALAYAHGKTDPEGQLLGIVHRDVSPQNILVSEQGEVKLTDFGIAKAMGKREQTGTGVVKGKIAFMSPEQALGKAVDARSDLFAVGVVLYQLMTGVRPFEGPTDLETLLRVQRGDFKPPHVVAPDLPPHVCAIISRAMQLDPDMRYQSAEEMLTDIEQVLRTVFRPVGQTELKRWLAALGTRDGQMPMAKAAHTPPHGRVTGGTGELEGKDVVLDDVDGEEATGLASIDEAGEMRRMTRQRTVNELPLPVPQDDESALSGKMTAPEFPLPLPDKEERPGRRRSRGGGFFTLILLAAIVVGGAVFGGPYLGPLREKLNALVGTTSATTPGAGAAGAPAAGAENAAAATPPAAHDAGVAASPAPAPAPETPPGRLAARKAEESESTHAHPRRERAPSEKADKPEKSERRRVDSLKNMMAPDPSLDPAPSAPPPPAPAPSENP
jgi:serine/threonine-protein kinase